MLHNDNDEVIMYKKILLFLALFCAFSFCAFADHEEVISTTDNDDNKEIYQLVVKVDDMTLRLLEIYKDTYVSGSKIKRDILNQEDMKTPEGMILEKRGNFNVLNLKSDNFDNDRGGHIVIDTLYNGITGERRNYDVDLARNKTGWGLFSGPRPISKFHVYVNKVVIFGKVGVKTIVME